GQKRSALGSGAASVAATRAVPRIKARPAIAIRRSVPTVRLLAMSVVLLPTRRAREHTMTRRPILIVGLVLLALGVASADEQWPQFRGAKSGIATDDPVLPDTWSPTENIVWKVDLPGRGWSSPVAWGDHVFITAAVNTKGSDESLKPVPAYTARSFVGPMSGRDIGTSSDP